LVPELGVDAAGTVISRAMSLKPERDHLLGEPDRRRPTLPEPELGKVRTFQLRRGTTLSQNNDFSSE
jgi:hypothetical protein